MPDKNKLAVLALLGVCRSAADLQTQWQNLQSGASWKELNIKSIQLTAADKILEWCERHHVCLTSPLHSDYPTVFYSLEKPPLFLSYWGKPVWQTHRCLSVVGGREPSRAALEWMDVHLLKSLRTPHWACVSGGARGVDQKAHALSLMACAPTVVLLPSGLGRLYPRDLQHWREQILCGGGAIVSEFTPYAEMWPSYFHIRNRLIAALGSMLLVVEARRKSGSLITARYARDMNRTLAMVPSSPLEPKGLGTLDLLCDGAFPIRDSTDLDILMAASAHSFLYQS